MIDWLPTDFLAQWGLAGLVLLAVLFGRLIPRSTHERELAQAAARGDEWRDIAQRQDARNDLLTAQVGELLELARTGNAVIQSLQQAASVQRGRGGGRS